MALLENLEGITGETIDWVRSIETALVEDSDTNYVYFDHYAYDMGMDPEYVTQNSETPPLGVHAVGVIATAVGWRPGLLVMRELAPMTEIRGPVVAADFSALRDFLTSAGRVSADDVGVIGIDPPSEQYAPVHGDLWGTLGMPVLLGDGSAGALTAGHVARDVGAQVVVGEGLHGLVTFSDHRAKYATPEPCADVAALRLPSDWKRHVSLPTDLALGNRRELKTLEAYNRSGTGMGGRIVRFAGDRFKVKETEGAWGDFAMVDPISIEGDSGALAIGDDARIAGQVVGGLSGAYSIVQSIDYLMKAAGVTPAV